jgi:hypothetical protein
VKISRHPRRKPLISNALNLTSFVSHSSALFCSFLHFFALSQNSTRFFSSDSALFLKKRVFSSTFQRANLPTFNDSSLSFSDPGLLLALFCRSLHQECFTTLFLSMRSTLFLKNAGCHPTIPILVHPACFELGAVRPTAAGTIFRAVVAQPFLAVLAHHSRVTIHQSRIFSAGSAACP